MNTKRSTVVFAVASSVLLVGSGVVFHSVVKRQKKLESMVFSLRDEQLEVRNKVAIPEAQVVERVVSNAQLWRPIQEKTSDTVVQVFSQVAEFDLLQPFKTPKQGSVFGSGFFINEQGDIITNAHVVDQTKAVWIQIPSLGKRTLDVEIVGVSPERDLALLRLKPESAELICSMLGSIPYLTLGDSDTVRRAEEVMALGYPLGQQSLKSTTGVVSGREHHFIQISAAINPGNSGGPLLNTHGEVVGVNSAAITSAQNVGYMIPINDLKIIHDDLYNVKLLRKPFLGILFNNASDSLTNYLGNPQPGGCYVVEVVSGSTLAKAGIQSGDMIYEINGHRIDIFGEMNVPWSEDKISLIDYVGQLSIGQKVQLVVYRSGKRKEIDVTFKQGELPAIRRVYPGYEEIDYEVFAGMVVMELTLNHIGALAQNAPGLTRYAELQQQAQPALVVTHIFPTSQLARERNVAVGATVHEVNGREVRTLQDFRAAVKEGATSKYLTLRVADNVARSTDNVFVSLELDRLRAEEPQLAADYHYQLTQLGRQMTLSLQKKDTARDDGVRA